VKPSLHLVAKWNDPRLAEVLAASHAAAKHVSDLARADIGRVNWAHVHIAADRRAPVYLAEPVKRTWL
jgi:hypothetical protein